MGENGNKKLGNYIEVINGFAFKSTSFLTSKIDNSLPVLKIKNVANGDANLDAVQYHHYDKRLSRYIVTWGDVLLALTGNHPQALTQVVGSTSRYKLLEKALLNQRVAKIRPLDLIDKNYLYYFLKDDLTHEYLANQSSGSANQANISKSDIENIPINLPPLPEQTAIASVLSSLDDKIDLLHRQNATLEAMAETLFGQWFVEEAAEEWEETILDKHIEVFRGLSYKGNGLTTQGLGIPMHNLNSVYEFGGYKNEGIKFYKGEYKDRHLVRAGDIIVTNTEQGHEHRLIGFPGIVSDAFGEMGIFSQHIYKIALLKETFLSTQFIYYLLMTSAVREQVIGATNGSTVNMLAIDGLQRPGFKLPPKEKVDLFSETVAFYWKKKNKNSVQIRTLTSLRDTLLPKLMSGEVRVEM